MEKQIEIFDRHVISRMKKIALPMGRFALFVVFFWFGALKVIGLSPANPLVQSLFEKSIDFMPFATFIILFGIYEMIIGICFLIRGGERLAIALLIPHMLATFLPLFMLTSITWSAPFVPTLEGQYIIKNLLVIASAIGLAAHLHPMHHENK